MQRANGELLALFTDKWSLGVLAQNKPHLTLIPLHANANAIVHHLVFQVERRQRRL